MIAGAVKVSSSDNAESLSRFWNSFQMHFDFRPFHPVENGNVGPARFVAIGTHGYLGLCRKSVRENRFIVEAQLTPTLQIAAGRLRRVSEHITDIP